MIATYTSNTIATNVQDRLLPIRFRTSMYQYSFFPHAVTLWNKLVSTHNIYIEDIVTVSVFKYFFRMHFTSSY